MPHPPRRIAGVTITHLGGAAHLLGGLGLGLGDAHTHLTQTSVNVCVKMCRVAADKMALQGDLDVLPVGGDHAAVAVLALGPRPLGQQRRQPGQHHTQLHASEVFSFFQHFQLNFLSK